MLLRPRAASILPVAPLWLSSWADIIPSRTQTRLLHAAGDCNLRHRIVTEVAAAAIAAKRSSPDGIELLDERFDKCRVVGENAVLEIALLHRLRAHPGTGEIRRAKIRLHAVNDDALKVYDKLIVIDGDNPEVWNSRGNLLTDMGMLEEAIESFDKAVEVCLDDSEMDAAAINRMGNASIDLGKLDDALECFNKAISLEKNNIDFLLNKGVVLMELGKFEEAVDSFNKVLLRNPDNEDAFFLKEECLEYF